MAVVIVAVGSLGLSSSSTTFTLVFTAAFDPWLFGIN